MSYIELSIEERASIQVGQAQGMSLRRIAQLLKRKLMPGTERFDLIVHLVRRRLSPEQVSGKLKAMKLPDLSDA